MTNFEHAVYFTDQSFGMICVMFVK